MESDEIELYDVYRVLREEWIWIAVITGLFAVGSVITALMMTEVYRAEVVVTSVADGTDMGRTAMMRQVGGLVGLAGVDLGALSGGGSQLATPYLRSRALVEEYIQRNDLIPVLMPDSDEPPTLWQATREFLRGVRRVDIDQRTGLITVSVEWTDPVIAAEWANGLVALANDQLRHRALTEAERNIAYLNEQIANTQVVGLQQAMFNLIENEMKTVMLANARREYAFAVVDPAVAPELRAKPHRRVLVMLGTILGGLVSILFVAFRRMYWNLKERDAGRGA